MAFKPIRGEDLIPVVADPATAPAVPAAADQTHLVGVRRTEERLSCWGAQIDQQPTTCTVGETQAADVDRRGIVCAHHVSTAQVQARPTQDAQASAEPVDF